MVWFGQPPRHHRGWRALLRLCVLICHNERNALLRFPQFPRLQQCRWWGGRGCAGFCHRHTCAPKLCRRTSRLGHASLLPVQLQIRRVLIRCLCVIPANRFLKMAFGQILHNADVRYRVPSCRINSSCRFGEVKERNTDFFPSALLRLFVVAHSMLSHTRSMR